MLGDKCGMRLPATRLQKYRSHASMHELIGPDQAAGAMMLPGTFSDSCEAQGEIMIPILPWECCPSSSTGSQTCDPSENKYLKNIIYPMIALDFAKPRDFSVS